MNQDQDLTLAYEEICSRIKAQVSEIQHLDLWYDQINYLEEEYPYPNHSVFIDINSDDIETLGGGVQQINALITVYHVFMTISDTYDGSENKSIAFEFYNVNRKLHKGLQNYSGTHFSALDRKSYKRIPTPEGYLIVRAQEYACVIMDYSGVKEYEDTVVEEIVIEPNPPAPVNETAHYQIDLTN